MTYTINHKRKLVKGAIIMKTLELVNKNKKTLTIIKQSERQATQFYVNKLNFIYTYGNKKAKERINKEFKKYFNLLKENIAQVNQEEYIKMFRFKEFTGEITQINYILRNIPNEERFKIYTLSKKVIEDNITKIYITDYGAIYKVFRKYIQIIEDDRKYIIILEGDELREQRAKE